MAGQEGPALQGGVAQLVPLKSGIVSGSIQTRGGGVDCVVGDDSSVRWPVSLKLLHAGSDSSMVIGGAAMRAFRPVVAGMGSTTE